MRLAKNVQALLLSKDAVSNLFIAAFYRKNVCSNELVLPTLHIRPNNTSKLG